jgi:CheY-like chemotaxis protein
VLDLQMPGLSGIDVYGRLRADVMGQSVQVLFDIGRPKVVLHECVSDPYRVPRKPFDLPDLERKAAGLLIMAHG